MTTKLYWTDPQSLQFSARVLSCSTQADHQIVVLDQTAFYPTGGGQPHDTGKIGSARVVDVTINDDSVIQHHLLPVTSAEDLRAGDEVFCEVDADRRLELTQQHTGQHILSQAFFQLFGAETRGFRINPTSSEIDLRLEATPDEVPHAIRQAEDLANRIVFANRPIRTHLVTPDEAARFPLRKETFIADCVRVIEIADFDWSACGGTHAQQTGEVGLIAVKHWERARQMIRVEFLCGVRALQDYRDAQASAEATARQFTVGRDAAPAAVAKLLEDTKQLKRRNREMAELLIKNEADALLEILPRGEGAQIITQIFPDHSFDELKLLAHQLVKRSSVIALLAVREKEIARLVFARSSNLSADLGSLMREACQMLNGKGGGTPDFAQGGGSNLAQLETVLQLTREKLG